MTQFKLMQDLYRVCHGHRYYYMEPPDAACLKSCNTFNLVKVTSVAQSELGEHVSSFDEFQNIVPNGKILADYIDMDGDNYKTL